MLGFINNAAQLRASHTASPNFQLLLIYLEPRMAEVAAAYITHSYVLSNRTPSGGLLHSTN